MSNNIDIILTAVDNATKVINNVSGGMQKMAEKASATAGRMNEFFENNERGFSAITTASATALAGLTALGYGAITQASKMQDLRQQFDTLTWSAEKGKKLFMEIQEFAAKTPFTSADLASATSTMLGFGVAQEKVMWSMKMLGDIAMGNNDRFQRLALAFGQVQASGRLMGQDLLQMINAGFNPLESIAKRTGETMMEVKDRMSDGRVSVQEVEQAMRDATGEGGRFFWGMEKASKTFSGVMSTLKDNVSIALAAIGGFANGQVIEGGIVDRLTDLMTSAMPYLESFTQWVTQNSTTVAVVLGVAAAVAALGVALGTIGMVVPAIVAGFTTLTAIFGAISAPVLAVVAVVTALGAAWATNLFGIRETTQQVWAWIIENTEGMRQGVVQIFDALKQFWEVWGPAITLYFKTYFETLATVFTVAWDVIVGVVKVVFDIIAGIIQVAWAIISGIITAGLQILSGDWAGAWETIKDIFSNVWEIIKTKAGDIMRDIKETIMNAWESVKAGTERILWNISTFVEGKFNAIRKTLQAIKDTAAEIASLGAAQTQTFNGTEGNRANGGYVSAGSPYRVGERGAEIFIPNTSGNIVPTDQLGAGSNSVNFYGPVNVRNDQDIPRLAKEISNELARNVQQYKLWINA